jgi:hypothetical protein
MAYYPGYATGKKGVMLGFSMLQLVTSKPKVVAIPEAQPTQPIPCSTVYGISWLLALILMHHSALFVVCAHGIIGYVMKRISAPKLPPSEDVLS